MKVIQNYNDKDTGKLRIPRKMIEEEKYLFEEYVKVTIQNNKKCICRISGFSDTIEEGISIDPMICFNEIIQSEEINEILSIEKIQIEKEIGKIKEMKITIEILNKQMPSILHSKNYIKYLQFFLNHLVISENVILCIHKMNVKISILSFILFDDSENKENNQQIENNSNQKEKYGKIDKNTIIHIEQQTEKIQKPIGYEEIIQEIQMKMNSKRCILIEGEHGSGKTHIIKYCAQEMKKEIEYYNCYQLQENKEIIQIQQTTQNKCIILDNIDCLLKNDSLFLLTLIKQIKQKNYLYLTSTQTIPMSFKSKELISETIKIPIPNQKIRYELLKTLNSFSDEINEIISKKTIGYLPKDLILLQNEFNSRYDDNENISQNENTSEKIKEKYFESMNFIRPTILVGSETEFDKLEWKDIGGLENVKKLMIEAIEWPITHSKEFKKLGIRPSHGVLLYGPSGCAKTSIVRATATMLNTSFITLSSASIYSPYVGDAEETIRNTFKRARLASPCIIFIDEIDTVVGIRTGGNGGDSVKDRVLSTLLNEMDGIEEIEGVILIAASNRRDLIDPALLRPGRFDCLIEVPKPDEETRKEIFKVLTRNIPIEKNFNFELLAKESEGKSGADIKWLISEACTVTLRENIHAEELKFDTLMKLLK